MAISQSPKEENMFWIDSMLTASAEVNGAAL